MTTTQICNAALANLGEAPIASFDEVSVLAEKCRVHYELERDTLLRMHRWNFARARVELTALSSDPDFGWGFQYELPSDCLRVLELNGREALASDDDFVIEGRKILTDADQAQIVYTKRETDVNLYDVLFIEALSYKLAVALCEEVTNSTSKKGALLQMFKDKMSEAGWTDAVETRPRIIPPTRGSAILAARRGCYTWDK